jgi:cytochrome c oxidase assembly factor 2
MTFRVLNFTQGRTFVSSLFGITFFAAVMTVSASNLLPCPARPDKGRFMDSGGDEEKILDGKVLVMPRQTRRWIEEKRPTPRE